MKKLQPQAAVHGNRGPAPRRPARRAFTMVEMMFSILILGILLALLIGGVRMVTRSAKGTVDRQTVLAIRDAGVHFKQLFGFDIPLVRERSADPVPGPHAITSTTGTTRKHIILVYKPTDADYEDELHGEELANMTGASPTNPFLDYRYSDRSIPFYLIGLPDVPVFANQASGPVVDGIKGPGFCKPLIDGGYDIPADILKPATGAAASKRVGGTYEPLIQVNSTAPKLYLDPQPDSDGFMSKAEVRDRGGVAIRYYRWMPDATINSLSDLNVPAIVGWMFNDPKFPGLNNYAPAPDRDLQKNPNLKGATFAIVAAGPDGVFGDEPLDVLCQKLGVAFDTSSEVKIRVQATKDNIVEVGQ